MSKRTQFWGTFFAVVWAQLVANPLPPTPFRNLFLKIPLESTAGIPKALYFKPFGASRALPEFSPAPVRLGMPLFQKWFWKGPLRAGHGSLSSAEGISDQVRPDACFSFNVAYAQKEPVTLNPESKSILLSARQTLPN